MSESETGAQKMTRLLDEIITKIDDINKSLQEIQEGNNETDKERKPV